MLGGACADRDEVASGERLKTRGADVLSTEIAADQACVGLADFDELLAGLMMRRASDVEAHILFTMSKDRKAQHIVGQDLQDFSEFT